MVSPGQHCSVCVDRALEILKMVNLGAQTTAGERDDETCGRLRLQNTPIHLKAICRDAADQTAGGGINGEHALLCLVLRAFRLTY